MKYYFSVFSLILLSSPTFANGYSTVLRFQDSQDTVMYLSDQFRVPKNDCIRDRKSVESTNVVGRVRYKMKEVYFPLAKTGVIVSNAPKGGGFLVDDPVDSFDAMVTFLKNENLLENATATKPVKMRVTCEYDICGKTVGGAVFYNFRDHPKCIVYIN